MCCHCQEQKQKATHVVNHHQYGGLQNQHNDGATKDCLPLSDNLAPPSTTCTLMEQQQATMILWYIVLLHILSLLIVNIFLHNSFIIVPGL